MNNEVVIMAQVLGIIAFYGSAGSKNIPDLRSLDPSWYLSPE